MKKVCVLICVVIAWAAAAAAQDTTGTIEGAITDKTASSVAGAGARVLEWHDQALAEGERKLHKRLRRLNHARPFWRSRQPAETHAHTRA